MVTANTIKIPANEHHYSDHGWLQSRFHFSFAEYYNPDKVHFGPLRVLNDDIVAAGSGFPPHPHRDMEIISYVVDGELTHQDNMGNKSTIGRGSIQYMSAGTGVMHSEYNHGKAPLRFLQIWILPDQTGHQPQYGDHRFEWDERKNKFLHMVGGISSKAPVRIHQDVNIYSIETNKPITFEVKANHGAYAVLAEGEAIINEESYATRDAVRTHGQDIKIEPKGDAHLLLLKFVMQTQY